MSQRSVAPRGLDQNKRVIATGAGYFSIRAVRC
jgi:hypothetical protein